MRNRMSDGGTRRRATMATRAGGWTPRRVADLAFWLRADAGDFTKDGAGLVSQWNDRSAAGNPALNDGADATKPAFTVDEIAAGIHAVVFDGVNDVVTIANDASLVLGTSDFTFAFVMKLTTPAASGSPFIHTATGSATGSVGAHGYDLYHRNSAQLEAGMKLDATAYTQNFTGLASPAVYSLITRVDRSGYMRSYLNGVAHGTPKDVSAKSGFSIGAPSQGVLFGVNASSNLDWDSAMAEAILYRRLLTVAETNTLGEHHAAKFGHAWTTVTV